MNPAANITRHDPTTLASDTQISQSISQPSKACAKLGRGAPSELLTNAVSFWIGPVSGVADGDGPARARPVDRLEEARTDDRGAGRSDAESGHPEQPCHRPDSPNGP
jgi:hypothetical protein